jgi:prepilin-type N-terminal cleavage/methylation domain-containing protein
MRLITEQSGFSLIELLTVMAVTLILSGVIFSFAIDYWGSSANIQADLNTFGQRLNANDELRQYISASNGLIIQNSIADLHVLNPDPTIVSGQYWTPLHAIPKSFPIGSSGTTTPVLYFRHPSEDKNHTIIMNGSVPYDDEYVLYLNGTTKQLMLRTLANSTVVNNLVTSSCQVLIASNSCPADKDIIDDVSSIDLRYFSRSGNLIDWTSIFDTNTNSYTGPDYPLVEAVEFDIHLSKKAAFHGVNNSVNQTIIRIALLNF